METIIKELVETLKKYNLTISTIESFTGGYFAKLITDVSGSSKVFYGSVVTYKTETKSEIVGVDKNIIKKYGVVSQEVANEMAIKGNKLFSTNITISFTGNAGPTVCEDNKAVGECYSAVYFNNKLYEFPFKFGKLMRNDIRSGACLEMAQSLINLIEEIYHKN